ncbi:MAG: winged helix-turn-helix transcriptional regulator, partial [Candidatus Omnitrophica bacterium]|nr:winged helix-turn-helix transcriptional regulator [Candidatus Omnitrophota bacterium]
LQKTVKLLADKTRLRILHLIYGREVMVKDICQILETNQPTVSRHLAKLRLLGIIIDKRDGNAIYYHINKNTECIKLLKVVIDECKDIDVFKADIEKFRFITDGEREKE